MTKHERDLRRNLRNYLINVHLAELLQSAQNLSEEMGSIAEREATNYVAQAFGMPLMAAELRARAIDLEAWDKIKGWLRKTKLSTTIRRRTAA